MMHLQRHWRILYRAAILNNLGEVKNDNQTKDLRRLYQFWTCYEIAGASLVDMKTWDWMYEHPDATPSELKEAVITIAKDVWNQYYAPVFESRDEPILAIYSHMIEYPLYLSNYSLAYMIQHQLEEYLIGKNYSEEIERIYTLGSIPPDIWMQQAVGSNLSSEPLIKDASEAVKRISDTDIRISK